MSTLYPPVADASNTDEPGRRYLTCCIVLAKGKGAALLDEPDYCRLSRFRWYFHNGYAARNNPDPQGPCHLYMHREVIDCPLDMVPDHINGNRLDNRRTNLRVVTPSANLHNIRRPSRNNTHGHLGAQRWGKRWKAEIVVNHKRIYLGLFDTGEEATAAYWKAKIANYPELFV